MNGGFGAWLVSPLGTAVLDFLLFAAGLAIGAGWGLGRRGDRAYEDGYDAAIEDHDRVWRITRPWAGSRGGTVMPHKPPGPAPASASTGVWQHLDQAGEWEPVHVGQALALVRDDLTDSAYTQDMAARMDRFLTDLLRVPYSADELYQAMED